MATLFEFPRRLNSEALETLRRLARELDQGAIAAVPTETVYGLLASITRPDALARLGRIKGRPENRPYAMFVPTLTVAREWATIPPHAHRLLEVVWPGPLTVVVPACRPETAALGSERTVGLRIPDHRIALALCAVASAPLAATSANRSGEEPLDTAEALMEEFGDELDFVVKWDSGRSGRASTVLDLTGLKARVLRLGELTRRELEDYIDFED